MKDNTDNFYAEFVVIENGEIVKFITNRDFEYQGGKEQEWRD
nr:MAG TPA: hypothetical protein [Bacteriophage sp.]